MGSVGGVDHGKEGYGDAPMVLRRWAMQRRVEDENSAWIVRCTLASVSTSTLLVASSCTTRDGQSGRPECARWGGETHENDDAAVLHQRAA